MVMSINDTMPNTPVDNHDNTYAIKMMENTFLLGIFLTAAITIFYTWGAFNESTLRADFFATENVYIAAVICFMLTAVFSTCKWLMQTGRVRWAIRCWYRARIYS